MKKSLTFSVISLLTFYCGYSQRLLTGRVLVDEDHGYPGIFVCDYSDLSNFSMVNKEGNFSIRLSDTLKYVLISKVSPTSSLFGEYNYLPEKFKIDGRDKLNLIITTEKNTFDYVPDAYKIRKIKKSEGNYHFQYKADTLTTILCQTQQSKYKFKLKYADCSVSVQNYLFNNNTKDYSQLSTIEYTFDTQGAIRKKVVNVLYGMHEEWELSLFFYRDNKIDRIEVHANKNFTKTIHLTMRGAEVDRLTQLIQNEILRKRLYSSCIEKSFDFDEVFSEIKE